MFRDILVAIDGSPHAARALAEAVDLAQRDNARLTIMTCVPDLSAWLLTGAAYGGGIDYVALNEEAERDYRELLDKAVFQVPEGVRVTKRLVHGRPGDRILEEIREGHHDLVVMGSRGRGNVSSLVLGSVSHQVLNAAPAAVLIVHAQDGTDGSPSTPRADVARN
ncbi:MAG TPA: universal stress protein [Solirubrobacteraceae bacterium]|nr:universal stress protein [Solirubrobacteraceae bacterium]